MKQKKKYRALANISFRSNGEWIHIKKDKITDSIPARSINWLLKDGLIKEVRSG